MLGILARKEGGSTGRKGSAEKPIPYIFHFNFKHTSIQSLSRRK